MMRNTLMHIPGLWESQHPTIDFRLLARAASRPEEAAGGGINVSNDLGGNNQENASTNLQVDVVSN